MRTAAGEHGCQPVGEPPELLGDTPASHRAACSELATAPPPRFAADQLPPPEVGRDRDHTEPAWGIARPLVGRRCPCLQAPSAPPTLCSYYGGFQRCNGSCNEPVPVEAIGSSMSWPSRTPGSRSTTSAVIPC